MSNTTITLTGRHPTAARRLLTAAHLYVLTLPAVTVLVVLTGHTLLAIVGVLALISLYGIGYTTAAYRAREQVEQARRDPLTGLPNRAPANEMLARATTSGTPVTVALADVDGLHMINRKFGMAAGDQYLLTIAHRLAQAVPAGGVLVRHSGDEFSIVAPGTDAPQLAAAIGAALAGPAVIAGCHIQPRASVGIAATDPVDQPGDANHIRARADAALYTAKRDGGNQIRVYDPDRDPAPSPDGTRPLLRRRDVNPLAADGVAWLPAPGDDLVPLLLSVADIHTLYHGLRTTLDLTGASAGHAPDGPQPPTVSPPDTGADRSSAATPTQAARYARLVEHLAPIINATPTDRTPDRTPSMASAVLIGISAQFPPHDVEALVITAAEAVYGQREDLSDRQLDLAARAYALLHDAVDG